MGGGASNGVSPKSKMGRQESVGGRTRLESLVDLARFDAGAAGPACGTQPRSIF